MKVKTYVPNMYSTYRIYQSIALQIAEMKSTKRYVLPTWKQLVPSLFSEMPQPSITIKQTFFWTWTIMNLSSSTRESYNYISRSEVRQQPVPAHGASWERTRALRVLGDSDPSLLEAVKVVHSLAFIACSLRYKLQFLYILLHILLPHKWPLSHRQVCYHRLNVPLPYEPCLALIGKGNLNHLRQLLLCDFDGNQVKKWLLPWQLTA